MGCAVSGVHAAVSFSVGINEGARKSLAAPIIKLTRKCSHRAFMSYLECQCTFKATQLGTRGKASWDDAIPDLSATIWHGTGSHHDGEANQDAPNALHGDCPEHSSIHVMVCPLCKHSTVALPHKLVTNNLAIKIYCQMCGRKTYLCKMAVLLWGSLASMSQTCTTSCTHHRSCL